MKEEFARVRVISEILEAGGKLPKGFRAIDLPLPDRVDENITIGDIADPQYQFFTPEYPLLSEYYSAIWALLAMDS